MPSTASLKTPRQHPKLMTAAHVQAILDACDRLRDRFLLSVLWESGIRIVEALCLRHEDLAVAEPPSTTLCYGCAAGPGSTSIRTGTATPTPPGFNRDVPQEVVQIAGAEFHDRALSDQTPLDGLVAVSAVVDDFAGGV